MNPVILLSSCLLGLATALAVAWGLPWLDRVTARQVEELKARMTALGIDHGAMTTYLRLWVALIAGIVVLMGPVMPPIAIALACLVYVAPRIILGVVVRRRSYLLRDQMVEASITLANSARAGMSLAQGIELVGQEAPQPLAAEFRRITNDFHRGKPLPEGSTIPKRD